MTIDKSKIRNAATVIVIRDRHTAPRILMGQRGATAAFMPNKFVFPGGAVDLGDAQVPLASMVDETCQSRLADDADGSLAHALVVAAIRELWEETGLILGQEGAWEGTPPPRRLAYLCSARLSAPRVPAAIRIPRPDASGPPTPF